MAKKNKKYYTTGEALRFLKMPKHKLYYLFDSRKLKDKRGKNNHRIYTEKMIEKIANLLGIAQVKR